MLSPCRLPLAVGSVVLLFLSTARVEAVFDLGINTIENGGDTSAARSQTVQRIVDAHLKWVRVDIVWSEIQPSAPTTQVPYNAAALAGYDDYVNQLHAAGLKIVVVNGSIPSWVTTANLPSAYASYMSFLAGHYKGIVNAYEIFNEVNTNSYWTATSYSAVLKAAYPQIKAADSSAQVVFAGLAYWYTTAQDFLTASYGQGAGPYFDVVAQHLYPIAGQDLGSTVTAVLNVMSANGDSAKKLWITEIGASTATGSYSESAQAAYTTNLDILRPFTSIEHVFWYELIDHYSSSNTAAQNAANVEYNFGIYRVDGTPKPIVQQLIDFSAPIGTWRYTIFSTFQNAGTGADLATPAGDGVPNLVKYASGLAPATPDSTPVDTTKIAMINGVDTLTLTFVRNTAATDVTYSVEAADSPAGPWTAIDPLAATNQVSVLANTPSSGLQTITVKDVKAYTSSTAATRLMRLRVSAPVETNFSDNFESLTAGSLGTQGGWTTQSTYASPNVTSGPVGSVNTTKVLGGTNSGTSLAYNSTLFSAGTISNGTLTLTCDIYYAGASGEYEAFGVGNTYAFYGSGPGQGPTFGIFASGSGGMWGIRPANAGTITMYATPIPGHWYTVQSIWTLNGDLSTGTLSVEDLTAGATSFTQLATGVPLGITSSDIIGAWNTAYVRVSPSTTGGYLDNLAFAVTPESTTATVPQGAVTLALQAGSAAAPVLNYISAPLQFPATGSGVLHGRLTGVTSSTLSNSAAGWTMSALASLTSPYFIKITSGSAAGHTFQITANSTTALTVDSQGLDLTSLSIVTGASGDTYEIYSGDTILGLFDTPSLANPIVGGTSPNGTADQIILYNGTAWIPYYFNTDSKTWRQGNSPVDRGPTYIRPDAGFIYSRVGTTPLYLTLQGVLPAQSQRSVTNAGGNTSIGSVFPVAQTLGGLNLQNTPGWRKVGDTGVTSANADTVLLNNGFAWLPYYYNGTAGQWRQGASPASRSATAISVGAGLLLQRMGTAATSVYAAPVPY